MKRRLPPAFAGLTIVAALAATPAFANMAACTSAAVKDNPADQIRLYTLCIEGELRRSDRGAAYNNRGFVHMRTGDLDSAFADFNRSIEYDPDFALAYFNRAMIHAQRGAFDLALADMDAALERPPSRIRTEIYIQRANVRAALGDQAGALADFEEALDRDDDRTDAMFGLAMLRLTASDPMLRDGEAALALGQRMLDEADRDAPPNPMPHIVLAAGHAETGGAADAVREQVLANEIMAAAGFAPPAMTDLLAHYQSGRKLHEFEGPLGGLIAP